MYMHRQVKNKQPGWWPQREVEASWEARSDALRRSRTADPEAALAAEARMAVARERAIAAQREREQRDAALLVHSPAPPLLKYSLC